MNGRLAELDESGSQYCVDCERKAHRCICVHEQLIQSGATGLGQRGMDRQQGQSFDDRCDDDDEQPEPGESWSLYEDDVDPITEDQEMYDGRDWDDTEEASSDEDIWFDDQDKFYG